MLKRTANQEKAFQDFVRDWLSILNLTRFTTGKERTQLIELDEKRGYVPEYTVPLIMTPSNQWRELTLRFEFLDKAEGYHVILEGIRVI